MIAMHVAPWAMYQCLAVAEMWLAPDLVYGWITICIISLLSGKMRLGWSRMAVS